MTIFGWDTSHYDGTISPAVAQRAHAEGIVFATAKIGEGGNYDDPADGSNLKAFRDAGIPVIGGYYVPRSGVSVTAQVAHCIALADRDEPWWRTFPGWFFQVDLELWGYDNVSAATGIAFGEQLRAATRRTVVLYASHGMYGDKLAAWDGPLWNANYPTNRQAPFRDLYPGDHYTGWDAYSGKTPTLCQYASSATIGGLTTCDANAFRGTLDELLTLINGGTDMPITPAESTAIADDVWSQRIPNMADRTKPDVSAQTALSQIWGTLTAVAKGESAEAAQIVALTAAVKALATSGGGSPDVAAILAGVDAAVAKHTDAVLARLAAAEKASADALNAAQ